jgi:putative transposase
MGKTRYKPMTLSADEFTRRFLLHALPSGFHRIRHYGLLANAGRREQLAQVRDRMVFAPMSWLIFGQPALRRSSSLYGSKMQRISEILQFPVIVERRRPLSIEPQPFEKFDFLLSHSTAE